MDECTWDFANQVCCDASHAGMQKSLEATATTSDKYHRRRTTRVEYNSTVSDMLSVNEARVTEYCQVCGVSSSVAGTISKIIHPGYF